MRLCRQNRPSMAFLVGADCEKIVMLALKVLNVARRITLLQRIHLGNPAAKLQQRKLPLIGCEIPPYLTEIKTYFGL